MPFKEIEIRGCVGVPSSIVEDLETLGIDVDLHGWEADDFSSDYWDDSDD